MKNMVGLLAALGLSAAIVIAQGDARLHAQSAEDPNAAPNPYRMEDFHVQLPDSRELGAPIGVEIDHSDGKTLWLFERCGGDSCAASTVDPVLKLDASGKMVANFGGGLVNWPHGFYVDRAGNVWVTDGRAENGKGHTVIKFSPDGKVLMTLGKPGQAGNAPGMFDTPSDVITASNGDIFVADGHGVMEGHHTNDRIVKLAKDGAFIMAVGDRSNNRVQIFDQSWEIYR